MCALLYFAHSQGIAFIVEQPSSSLMNKHPTFARLLELLSAQTCFLPMRAYGAMSLKPTVLWEPRHCWNACAARNLAQSNVPRD